MSSCLRIADVEEAGERGNTDVRPRDRADTAAGSSSNLAASAPLDPPAQLEEVLCPDLPAWITSDTRAPIPDLLAAYAAPIQAIKQSLGEVITSHPADDPLRPDELYILRNLLSKKTTAGAAATVRRSLEERRKPEFLTMAQICSQGGWYQYLEPRLDAAVYALMGRAIPCKMTGTSMGDRVDYVLHGNSQAYYEFFGALTNASFVMVDSALMETTYQFLDRESRRRGHLVKVYSVHDFRLVNVMSLIRNFWQLSSPMGDCSRRNAFMYPQLEGKIMFGNSTMLSWAIGVMKYVLSEQTMSKVIVQDPLETDTDNVDGLRIRETFGSITEGDPWTQMKALEKVPIDDSTDLNCSVKAADQIKNKVLRGEGVPWWLGEGDLSLERPDDNSSWWPRSFLDSFLCCTSSRQQGSVR